MLLATFGSVLLGILYVIIAILILMIMITIHELGHFIAGKALGFKINEFAIGMGPKIFSRKSKKDGQVFSIRAIPLGGFCAFEGEDEENPSKEAFNNQKPWKRFIVLFSGAFMNFVSAVVVVIIAFTCFGDVLPQVHTAYDTQQQVFQEGDRILKIDGKTIYLSIDVSEMISEAPEECKVLVLRGDTETEVTAKKSNYTIEGENYYGWGIRILTGGSDIKRVDLNLGESIARSVPYCIRTAGFVLETLGGLITGLIGLDQIGGPITTIDITSQVVETGLGNVLMLFTMISVNLAVFNLLPVPALDGSKMVFVLIEWIFRKPINRKVEGLIHFIGLITLFAFVILIDVFRLFKM